MHCIMTIIILLGNRHSNPIIWKLLKENINAECRDIPVYKNKSTSTVSKNKQKMCRYDRETLRL